MRIDELQAEVNRRWGSQEGNPCSESSEAGHALVHLMKALGKVASAVNDAEHEKRVLRPDEVEKYLADLVICSARLGNGVVDLNEACHKRLGEKFPWRQSAVHVGPDGKPVHAGPCVESCGKP
jgi:hypothetical protein